MTEKRQHPRAPRPEPEPVVDGVETEELRERVALLERERDEQLNDLKRLAADFDNFRKRAERDRAALVAHASERLVKELLPVLDDLERALAAADQREEAVGDPVERRGGGVGEFVEGVRLVERSLRTTLEHSGLQEIEADGARFDPHLHEALLTQPADVEEGTILQVLQRGYRLGERVLRPARVVIAQGGSGE